jgi:hypothetical protein
MNAKCTLNFDEFVKTPMNPQNLLHVARQRAFPHPAAFMGCLPLNTQPTTLIQQPTNTTNYQHLITTHAM